MRKASIVVDAFYQGNRLFDMQDEVSNRDDCLRPMFILKQEFLHHGIDLSTNDINNIKGAEFVIFSETPEPENQELRLAHSLKKPMYLLMMELGLIRKGNFDQDSHTCFKKIFTCFDDYVDNEKYFKINYSFILLDQIDTQVTTKRKLCVMIAGNKSLKHPLELYSKRIEAIRWFERNHLDDFDLYGIGWDSYRGPYGNKINKTINKVPLLQKWLSPHCPSYRGTIRKKHDVLTQYKFSICYENAKEIRGYITEKIFDCFFAACIPIYWGASNVTDHIPSGCFIDKRDFSTYEELYKYISSMTNAERMKYHSAINSFLTGNRSYPFSVEYFVKTISCEILSQFELTSAQKGEQ